MSVEGPSRDDFEKGRNNQSEPEPLESTPPSQELSRGQKVLYLSLLGLSTIVSLGLKFWGKDALSWTGCEAELCHANQAVYRISFADALWFLMLTLGTAFSPRLQHTQWGAKLLFYAGFMVAAFYIPSKFFLGYAEFARVVSVFFLVLQIIILLDFAYDLHEYLLDDKITGNEEEDPSAASRWKCIYLFISFLLWGGALASCGWMLHYYGQCELTQFFIALTIVLGITSTLVSMLPHKDLNRGVLTPSVVFAYCAYLCWQTLYSHPDLKCNPNANQVDNLAMLLVGLAITTASLIYTVHNTTKKAPDLFRTEPLEEQSGAAGTSPSQDAVKPWVFHFLMVLASCYMAMLITGWAVTNEGHKVTSSNTGLNKESMWIKISAQWVTWFLYFWTLLAPICFPGRDFSSPDRRRADKALLLPSPDTYLVMTAPSDLPLRFAATGNMPSVNATLLDHFFLRE
eukprot:g59121.t1